MNDNYLVYMTHSVTVRLIAKLIHNHIGRTTPTPIPWLIITELSWSDNIVISAA